MRFWKEFIKGIWEQNPIFRIVLGLCPTLAVTTLVENGIGMGLAATFVLIGSNIAISSVRNIVPAKVRIPCYIVIIATFVTIVDLIMNAFAHALYQRLGIFIPLIVVNCIILGRAEAFASKNSIWLSIADALGMGLASLPHSWLWHVWRCLAMQLSSGFSYKRPGFLVLVAVAS